MGFEWTKEFKYFGLNISFSFSYFGTGWTFNIGDFTNTLEVNLVFLCLLIFHYKGRKELESWREID